MRTYQSQTVPAHAVNAKLLLVFTQYPFSYDRKIECFRTHVEVDIFLVFVCVLRISHLRPA
jgi:hypothetical protein